MANQNQPFGIKFIAPTEIRMGSPYNGCEIQIVGQAKIKLTKDWWQDKCAWSDDYKYLVLIQWNLDNNDPGFHFVIFNTITGKSRKSERLMGLINELSVKDNRILYNKFLHNKNEDRASNDSDHTYEFANF